MLSKKQLQDATKELQDVLGCDPPLESDGEVKDLIEGIKDAIDLIEEDEFSPETQLVIDTLRPPVVELKAVTEIDDIEDEEATPDYVDQDKDVIRIPVAVKTPRPKSTTANVLYFEKSDVVSGLVVGSTVSFVTAPNSRVAPKQTLTGKVLQIKIDHNKTGFEVVKIDTKVGSFFKYSKSVKLITPV